MILLAYRHGFRASELVELSFSDVATPKAATACRLMPPA
jgi:site-specific recombinase XerD